MREICQSGSEGGVALTCHPYPYQDLAEVRAGNCETLSLPYGTKLQLSERLPAEFDRPGDFRHAR